MRIILSLLFMIGTVCGQSTIHILSPWANDPALVANRHHALGAFSDWSANDNSLMTDEGNGWFSFTIPGEITDWWKLTLENCPTGSDQNCTGGEEWAITPNVLALLGGEPEIWVYPDASALGYHTELIPPGAKIVWFKSPWGNKSLPNMIVGADTISMHYATDPVRCGWFYAALRGAQITLGNVHFQRPFSTLTVPLSSTIDLSGAIATGDSIFVDGTLSPLTSSNTAGTAGACFDSSKVVHVYHPWPLDPSRSTRPVYLHAGNLVGNYVAMKRDDSITGNPELKNWFSHSFPGTTNWSQNENLEFMSYFPGPENGRLTYYDRPAGKTLFPKGVYEVWLVPMGNNFHVIQTPVSARYIQIRNPWGGTVPRLLIDGDTVATMSIPDTCGWYRAILWEEPAEWKIRFKQAIGFDVYSNSGLSQGEEIDVDSIMSLGKSVWIIPVPYPAGPPKIGSTYQGPPGDCPNRDLAVMIMDWANSDTDFGKVYDGSDAADDNSKCPGLVPGMIEPVLGPAGLPVPVATPPTECTAMKNLANWFTPQIITGTYTNATCYDLPLRLDDEGFWLADIAADSARNIQGFFPVDDFKFLDDAQTIPNPKYELEGNGNNIDGMRITDHNYLFSMQINANFVYVPGQYFEFRGDDDVWVFINNKLVVDIGGVHAPIADSVDLDTLGLTPGKTYPFHIFFTERNCCGSNFKMRTSMDLQTDRAYYPVQVDAGQNIIRYDIYQILHERTLTCDFSASGSVDTVLAPSSFLLQGPQFPNEPVPLVSGVNYGGITIDENYSAFTIDTNAIVMARTLAPGLYTLVFTNSVDITLSSRVTFVVPAYPLPAILFTDASGNPIDPDTVSLGEWAFIPYPVHVQARYVGVPCETCTDVLQLTTLDSLIFVDSLKKPITSVTLKNGVATFWVMGLTTLDSAEFRVSGASVQNELIWRYINLKEPPVPSPKFARMFDRNGDGVCDSLIFAFARALKGKDAADSLEWKWGDSTSHWLDAGTIRSNLWKDSSIVIKGDSLYPGIFTGSKDGKPYSGSSTAWFTYVNDGIEVPFAINPTIEDHVGPIVTKAYILPGSRYDTLEITVSETMAETQDFKALFSLSIWRNGVDESASPILSSTIRTRSGNKFILLFSSSARIVPTVGDSVRFTPGVGLDLSNNTPHAQNPKVRIYGRQRGSMAEPDRVVTLDPKTAPDEDSPVVIPSLVIPGTPLDEVIEEKGMPGQLIHFDFANAVESSPVPLELNQVGLFYEIWYYSILGEFVNHTKKTITCADSIFKGDCTKNNADIFLGWNMRSKAGRLVGTGVYPVHFNYRIKAGDVVLEKGETRINWGIRRK